MNFYNHQHKHYCGIDLHARSVYVCILDHDGEILLHKECPAKSDRLLALTILYDAKKNEQSESVVGAGAQDRQGDLFHVKAQNGIR